MKVTFTTNIDAYKLNCFPTRLTFPPRVGDFVSVTNPRHFQNKKLPSRLEVTRVTWIENDDADGSDAGIYAVCELWYNETDKRIADLAGAQTL